MLSSCPSLRIDVVPDVAALRTVQDMEERIFGESAVRWESVSAWWSVFPMGIHTIHVGSDLAGYLSLWPVTQSALADVLGGIRGESDICAYEISPVGHRPGDSWWYWCSLALEVPWRRRGLGKLLGDRAFSRWLRDADDASLIHVGALAWSSSGATVLQRRGFQQAPDAGDAAHGMIPYARTSSADAWRRS